ncbi:MAG: amino acid adenylation domain-containing protein [Acidimicrobiia bacterium]|nr:amino acid adenylation domain-containing protein [Acidimicrobiia bacterium]
MSNRSHAYLLPHLIEQAADASPDADGLRFRDGALTYSELYGRACALANGLLEDGMQPGDRVGILLRKGLESAVALYGVMMAGGVYVPLDPFAPAARIEFVLRDCGIQRLVAGEQTIGTLLTLAETGLELQTVFGVPDEGVLPYRMVPWSTVEPLARTAPVIATTEQDLCYILYTSGSTGSPKGIMHTHRSALSWAEVAASAYELGPNDVVSNYAPLHFDLSTLDYFAGARAGATTTIIPEEVTRFPASLAAFIADERLTVFYTVPMALIHLAQPELLAGRDLDRLRLVLFGGEPMPIKHLRRIMQLIPTARFVNVYGPTETNGVTHYPVEAVPSVDDEALPIGRPYPNVDALVVDAGFEPVPNGEPGELVVRTPTMMRGYWGRDDLNDRAFHTRTPFGGLPDVYHRTGDLAAMQPDGTVRFLGRKDRQIKSRGNRVELDEVEAVLVNHPLVREAAVYAMSNEEGLLEIRAEAIPVQPGVESGELIRHLRSALPSYAVPARIVLRDSFPRTSTGKIDRLAMEAEALATGVNR